MMSRRVFREKALRRFNDSVNKTVLPRYATPPWRLLFWLLGTLLLGLTILLWWAELPVYTSGPGIVMLAPSHYEGREQIVLVAFLPPTAVAHVALETKALINIPARAGNDPDAWFTAPVIMIEKLAAPPAKIRDRYALDASEGLLVDGPTLVVLIELDDDDAHLVGSLGEVQVQVATQRGLALLPGLGRLFATNGEAR